MKVQDEKCYIGIDVSKANLDVYVLPWKKFMQFKNDAKGISKLVKKLHSLAPSIVAMEATGGYEQLLAQSLSISELPVAIMNPRQIRDFAKSRGILAKTDRLDAETIALFAEERKLTANFVYNEDQQQLAERNARRRQLIEMITMEKNRLDKVSKEGKKSIQRIIKVLEKELAAINEMIAFAIENDTEYSHKNTLLKSIKGVGPIVAAGLITDLPELGQLKAKQISALAGLAPFNKDSGAMRGKRMISGGRASVRSILYMATLVATRHNAQIKKFYERLCNSGKKKKVALTACMHKLLIIMNAMIKNNEEWRELPKVN
jgi:transposase